jgi:ribosomal protein L11 methyltransferase
VVDDERPTAVDDRGDGGVVLYFGSVEDRDRALLHARAFAAGASLTPLSVSDESWAERSQASIGPVRVGRIVLTPPWAAAEVLARSDAPQLAGPDLVITIVPSMGFGTGHHASTRLCLDLLQGCDLAGRSVIDAGTGSGALALAAWRLGAARVVAIDSDPDAVQSARENVAINGAAAHVDVRLSDLAEGGGPVSGPFDVAMANLTGALLERFAPTLAGWLAPGGCLIVSGLLEDEERAVADAFAREGLAPARRAAAYGWAALTLLPGAILRKS